MATIGKLADDPNEEPNNANAKADLPTEQICQSLSGRFPELPKPGLVSVAELYHGLAETGVPFNSCRRLRSQCDNKRENFN